MSLFKTLLVICALVCCSIYGLMKLREKGTTTSILASSPSPAAAVGRISGEPALSSATPGGSAGAAIALSNDPRRTAPAQQFAQPATLDPERVKRYQDALEQFELDGCNRNGTFAVRLKNDRRPRMMHSGDSVELPGGLTVSLRMHGYPNCKVDVYDGKIAIGEVAGF
jgi:hypothetical protein